MKRDVKATLELTYWCFPRDRVQLRAVVHHLSVTGLAAAVLPDLRNV
jgi:hypothetical protein